MPFHFPCGKGDDDGQIKLETKSCEEKIRDHPFSLSFADIRKIHKDTNIGVREIHFIEQSSTGTQDKNHEVQFKPENDGKEFKGPRLRIISTKRKITGYYTMVMKEGREMFLIPVRPSPPQTAAQTGPAPSRNNGNSGNSRQPVTGSTQGAPKTRQTKGPIPVTGPLNTGGGRAALPAGARRTDGNRQGGEATLAGRQPGYGNDPKLPKSNGCCCFGRGDGSPTSSAPTPPGQGNGDSAKGGKSNGCCCFGRGDDSPTNSASTQSRQRNGNIEHAPNQIQAQAKRGKSNSCCCFGCGDDSRTNNASTPSRQRNGNTGRASNQVQAQEKREKSSSSCCYFGCGDNSASTPSRQRNGDTGRASNQVQAQAKRGKSKGGCCFGRGHDSRKHKKRAKDGRYDSRNSKKERRKWCFGCC